MKLYDIPTEAQEIEDAILETQPDAAGNYPEELVRRVQSFMSLSSDKLQAGAMIVRNLERDAASCKAEADRLSARATILENNADRLKGLMLWAVDHAFAGKIRTPLFSIWGQNSAEKILLAMQPDGDIYMLQQSHPEYVRQSDPELNVSAIQDAVKNKKALPDCIAVEKKPGTRFLRIK